MFYYLFQTVLLRAQTTHARYLVDSLFCAIIIGEISICSKLDFIEIHHSDSSSNRDFVNFCYKNCSFTKEVSARSYQPMAHILFWTSSWAPSFGNHFVSFYKILSLCAIQPDYQESCLIMIHISYCCNRSPDQESLYSSHFVLMTMMLFCDKIILW